MRGDGVMVWSPDPGEGDVVGSDKQRKAKLDEVHSGRE